MMVQPASKVQAVLACATAPPEKAIDDEIAKFKAIRTGVFAEGPSSRFYENGLFDQKRFWYEHRQELPLHYNTYVPEVGSQKATSANVETVFSGVGLQGKKVGLRRVLAHTAIAHASANM